MPQCPTGDQEPKLRRSPSPLRDPPLAHRGWTWGGGGGGKSKELGESTRSSAERRAARTLGARVRRAEPGAANPALWLPEGSASLDFGRPGKLGETAPRADAWLEEVQPGAAHPRPPPLHVTLLGQSAPAVAARGPGGPRRERGTSQPLAEWPPEAPPPPQLRGPRGISPALRAAQAGQVGYPDSQLLSGPGDTHRPAAAPVSLQ